ncbi:MAG: hypothetical protein OEY96_14045 [Gammaproteobacteria bacterium]|nr:hypothetical protein [Gammaproteobacteria bacterium]
MVIFKKILLGLVTLVISLITIVLLINLSIFDEELDPEIQELIKPKPLVLSPDNAYFAYMGISASADKDMMESGMAFVKRYAENRNNGIDDMLTQDYLETLGKRIPDTLGDNFEFCSVRKQNDCVSKINKQIADMPADDPLLLLQLQRYQTMIKLQKFEYPFQFSNMSLLPGYSPILKLNKIQISTISQQLNNSKIIKNLIADIKFWRMALDQDNLLIGKMIALEPLWSDLGFLSDFIRKNNLNEKQIQKIKSFLLPLSNDEKDFIATFDTEFIYVHHFLANPNLDYLAEQNNMFYVFLALYQPNASINMHYRSYVQPMKDLSELSLADFLFYLENCKNGIEQDNVDCIHDNIPTPSYFNLSNYYNLTGKFMLSYAAWPIEDYIARVHDLNTMIRLVNLQLSLKTVDKELIPQAIKESEFNNPYTNKPMDYDAENGWLSFECLDKSSVCKVKL